jgi:Protein of unknown function (DUF1214)
MKRQALGDRDKLVTNADGSVDFYLQADSPGAGKEANWLPVAKAPFTLLMRLYSPRDQHPSNIGVPFSAPDLPPVDAFSQIPCANEPCP